MKPLVSVMMPAWNASRYISDAIESMQAQTYKNWQLCIVDDGSEDETYGIAQTFLEDVRICVDRIEHSGCPTARNSCLRMMEGDIFARLDADDIHDPVRLERQVEFLLANENVDIVTCGMTWLKGTLKMPKPTVKGMSVPGYMTGKSNGPCNASLVAWRRVYDVVGGYDDYMLAASDGDWNFRAIVNGFRWGYIDEMWYHQRRHDNQISKVLRPIQRKIHEQSRAKYHKIWKSNG